MPGRVTLADRIARQQKMRAVLDERDKALKEKERIERRRRLLLVGGFAERAGLLALSNEAHYGALLSLGVGSADEKKVEKWAAAGKAALEREQAAVEKIRVPIIITFPDKVSRLTSAALRQAGFRYNQLWNYYEGRSDPEEAEELAKEYGGRVEVRTDSAVDYLRERKLAEESNPPLAAAAE